MWNSLISPPAYVTPLQEDPGGCRQSVLLAQQSLSWVSGLWVLLFYSFLFNSKYLEHLEFYTTYIINVLLTLILISCTAEDNQSLQEQKMGPKPDL